MNFFRAFIWPSVHRAIPQPVGAAKPDSCELL